MTESETRIHTAAELYCTPEGQVARLPGARSLFDFAREQEVQLAAGRRQLWQDRPAALKRVREITGIRPLASLPPVQVESGPERLIRGMSVHPLVLAPEPGIRLPALRFARAGATADAPRVLYLQAEGKHVDAGPGGPIERLVLAGKIVLAVDVRGIGETSRPRGRGGFSDLMGGNWKDVTHASLLGTSFVTMRAEDVLVCMRYLAEEASSSGVRAQISLVAVGEVGVAALHAAALEPQLFASLELRRALTSWADVVRTPEGWQQQVNAVFGALRVYDLPDLAASLPAAQLTILEPLDAAGRVVATTP